MVGGARPNSGRKPFPFAKEHASNKEKEERKEVLKMFKTKAKVKMPNYLSDGAKKEWRRIMRYYASIELDVLSELDTAALVQYCEAWNIYKIALEDWKKIQHVATTKSSAQAVINRLVKTMNEQSLITSRLAEQLYLTPAGRARMGVQSKKKEETLEDLIDEYGEA